MNNLRKLRSKKTNVPNLKAKLWALRLMDEVDGKDAFVLPGSDIRQDVLEHNKICGRTCSTLRACEGNVLPVLGSPYSDASKQSSTDPGRTCSTLSTNGNNDSPVLGCTSSTLSAMINRDDSEEEKKIKLHSAAQVLH